MRLNITQFSHRNTRLLFALTIALALAVTHVAAQYGAFDSAYDGELWGVRQELILGESGEPAGVAYINGTLFVADRINQTVVAYDAIGGVVTMAGADWDGADESSPVFGMIPNELAAVAVEVDGDDTTALLVSDLVAHRVFAFDAAGAHLFTLQLDRPSFAGATGAINGMAMGPGARFVLTTGATPALALQGSFAAAWTNAFDSEGAVLAYRNLAAINYNAAESRFEPTPTATLDGTEGSNLAPPSQLPMGVAFDSLGNLYAIDTNTERFNVYDESFAYRFEFGTPVFDGTLAEFSQPYGMAYSPADGGRLIIGDSDNHRVLIYRPDLANDTLEFVSAIEGLGDGYPRSVALDATTGRIAVSDLENGRVWVLDTPNLAAFNLQVLDVGGAPTDSVCAGDPYQIQFSLTVPAGRPAVSGVVPQLSIDGVVVTDLPAAADVYSGPMSAGQVATYTYSLVMPAVIPIDGFLLTAGATSSTTDVLFREGILSGATCVGLPPSITAIPNIPAQVSGWTPVRPTETFELTLSATDDAGVASIEYQIVGQNDPGTTIPAVINPTPGTSQTVVLSLPEMGLSTVKYRANDSDNRKSAWQQVDLRLVLVANRQTNEGQSESFAVGMPVGVNYTFSASGLPASFTIDASTGLISGQATFDDAGVYSVVVTESDGTNSSSVDFSWTILHINRPPVIQQPTAPAAGEGQAFSLQIIGSDPDGDRAFFTTYGRSVPLGYDLPPSITIDAETGLISGTFPFDSEREYVITVGLSECSTALPSPPCVGDVPGERLATLTSFTVSVANGNRAPYIINPGTRSNTEGDVVSLPIIASDPDVASDGQVLTYRAQNLPPGLSINSSTGVISGTIGYNALPEYAVTVEVDDAVTDPTSLVVFTWSVAGGNRQPTVAGLPDRTDAENTVVSIDVTASDDDGDALTYSASNLPPGVSIDSATGVISGPLGFNSAGVYAVVVTVSDGATVTNVPFVWTVTNVNRPPTITVPDRTGFEGRVLVNVVIATVGDPDLDALTFSATGLPPGLTMNPSTGTISGTIPYDAAGVYQVRMTVNDNGTVGASAFDDCTWTIRAVNRPPTVSSPDRTSIEGEVTNIVITSEDLDNDILTFTMTGLPATHSIDPVTGAITGTFSYTSAGTYNVRVTVFDGTDTRFVDFVWTVLNVNRHPVLVTENQVSVEGQTVALQINGTDPDGDTLNYTMNGLPPGFTIDPGTGIISGTFDFDSAGVYTVNVGAADAALAVLNTFTWTVSETNRPPAVGALPDRTNAENDTVSVAVTASDADGNTLAYSAINLPPGLSINPLTGLIAGTLTYNAWGVHAVQVLVFDGLATTTRTFSWDITNVNRPPTASAPDRTNAENDTVSFSITSSDPDGDVLTFSASGLPAGISIQPATGVIGGTLGYSTAGTYNVVVTVADASLSANAPFVWTVTNTNAPPVITNPGDQTDAEGESISVTMVASDVDGEALTYSATGLPAGLTIDANTGVVTGSLGYDTAGTYPVTLTVSDGVTSRSVAFTWTVTNVNRPPVVVNPGPQNSAEGAVVALPISASDPDLQALTYSATGLPPGLSIGPLTGIIAGSLGYTVAGPYTVTVSASDGSLSDSETFTWTVTNTNRPPTAEADFGSVVQGQSTTISVLANDTDPDGAASLSIASVTTPTSGSAAVNANGTITFTANATFIGLATFSYTVTDGLLTSTALVSINIQPSNHSPVCSAAFTGTDLWPPNHRQVYVTISGVTDPDGGTPTIRFSSILQDEPTDSVGQGNTMRDGGIENNGASAWVRAERSGTKKVPGDGRVYLIGFTATDALGASCTGTVRLDVPHDQRGTPAVLSPGRWDSTTGLQVSGPPAAPVANDDSLASTGSPSTLTVLGNDVSYGQTLTVSLVSQPSKGQATVNSNGSITYTPPSGNWTGTTTFTYQVRNASGSTDTAVVTVIVARSNDDDDDDNDHDGDDDDDCGDRNHDHARDSDNRERDHRRGDHDRCRHDRR